MTLTEGAEAIKEVLGAGKYFTITAEASGSDTRGRVRAYMTILDRANGSYHTPPFGSVEGLIEHVRVVVPALRAVPGGHVPVEL